MNWIYILCVLAAAVIAEEYFEREKRAPGRNCPRITNFPGRVKYKRRGTRAQFRCTKTFIRYGNKAVNCRSDNTWSGEPPICLKAGCVPIDIAVYHKLDMKEMYGGALLSFSCEDEFQLMGPDQIYCDSKTWSDVPPVCKATAQLTECDFEQGLCGWSQDDSDDLDWAIHQGQTSTGGTGPKTDHTFQTISGHYMFVESSNPARNGDQARLLSPLYPADMGNMCFEFWYHLLGPADPGHVGTLEVFIRGDSQFLDDLQPVFVKGGNQGDDWKQGEIYIDKQDEPYQIVIVTTRKLSYISDIAIDDVRLYNCSDTKTTSTTSETTTTRTTSSITSLKPPISTPSLGTPSQTSKPSTFTKIKPSSVTASMSTFIASSGAVTQSTSTKTVQKTSPIATTLISSTPTSKREVSTRISKTISTPTVAVTTNGAAFTTKVATSSSQITTTPQNETPEATTTRLPSTALLTTSKTPTTKTSSLSSTEQSSVMTVPSSAASTSSAHQPSTSSPIPPSKSITTSTTKTSILTGSPVSSSTAESTKGSTQLHTSTVSPRSSLSTTQRGLPASTSNNARTTGQTTLLFSTTIQSTPSTTLKPTTTLKRWESTSVQSTTQSSTTTLQKSQSTTATKRTKKTKVTKWKDHTTTPRKTTAVNTNTDLYNTKPPVGSRTTIMMYVNETEPTVVIAEQRSQHPEDETLKPLMIGLGVGIVAGLIIIGIVAWVCVRRRKFYTSRYEDELKPITKSSSSENFNNIQYEYHDDEFQ